MGNVQKLAGLRRWRPRRLAFAATALLAGCATATRDAAVIQAMHAAEADGRRSNVLFRLTAGDSATTSALSDRAGLWNMDTGQRLGPPGGLSLSRTARAEGWRHDALLPSGRYFLRLLTPDPRDAAPADLTFTVPDPAPPVLYIGSFRLDCPAQAACRVSPVAADQSDAARALLAAEAPSVPPPATRLAQPYPAPLAATGLPRPAAPEIRVDPRLWVAAVDWNSATSQGALPPPPSEGAAPAPESAPRSEGAWPAGAEFASVADMSAAFEGMGYLAVLGVGLAIIVVAVPIALIARAIAEDQRNRRSANQARIQAEALRAAALAQEQWGPCAAGIAMTLAPDNVERRLRAAFAPQRAEGRRAALPDPWDVTVSRVIFRQCGTKPDHHGVEVATRWTARRPGEADPAFDIAFARRVAGATPDRRLVFSEPPPWELRTASEAACRPLADYCNAAGSARLLEEVTRGVAEARDAVAAR
ncbi:hypothetical protein [Neoroseomonas oryzicola]|uniref:Uncharacterized protein n=1 Tax=Neoroseomonas oryzicola TaxID=535904 RepID=A0A9X9WFN8_9PROT|nr:hypothetical protein [Neoroseomonas oryzicola]MBR0659148.1 hypothetical protein [Neoroseomonas oryzicola]NKE17720.1 hypothetical protein [Neoroseomonas oryzicola]